MKNCLFCQRKKIGKDILAESSNWIIKVGVGIATAGHIMIISKKHFSCLADLPKNLFNEYEKKIHPILEKYIKTHFTEPFRIEYGIFKQTIPHMHIHYIPLNGDGYSIKSVLDDIILPERIPYLDVTYENLQKIKQTSGKYVFVGEKNRAYIYLINGKIPEDKLEKILGFRIFLKEKGANIPFPWTNMTTEQKLLDKKRKQITREKFKDFARILS